jgi:nucleotide-binding universal stress UspA family protein
MFPAKTILHPTDFSEHSESAFEIACALARDYDAKLLLLHVRPPAPIVYGELVPMPPEPPEAKEMLKSQLAALKPADSGITVERSLVEGEPATEIVHAAKAAYADLIVMGTHGRAGLSRLLMGSVAEQVLRKADCPVLTVKTPSVRNAVREHAHFEAVHA